MITDLEKLIDICKQELHDREYCATHAVILVNEWDSVAAWFQEKGAAEFSTELGYQYCDEAIGAHIIVEGMSSRQKLRLRAVRMLTSYQKDGDFEFRSPRIDRVFEGETGALIKEFLYHEREIGRTERTIECREIYLYPFNLHLLRKELDFNMLSIDAIEDFFKSMGYELCSRHNSANHLRQLFHYLYEGGYTTTDNALYVLKDQYRAQNKLPTTYTEEEIARTLAAVDRSSAIGRRDYLIILLNR